MTKTFLATRLILPDNKFVNSFFAKQCSIMENNNVLSSASIPNTDQTLNSWRMILKESSLDSILIKLMVMIGSVFACWKCPAKLWKNLLKYSKIAKNVEYFQMTIKKETLYRFLKKATNRTSKTIIQSLFLPICSKIFERVI